MSKTVLCFEGEEHELKTVREINHKYTDEIVCPHCGKEYSDSHEFFEGHQDSGETECDECGKGFSYSRDFDVHYYTSKKCKSVELTKARE